MPHYDFFQNKQCEYFPCHKTEHPDEFSCLFCYCPLYALGKNCGGNFSFTTEGIKDCSKCLLPHRRENYKYVCSKIREIMEMVKTNAPIEHP